MDPSPAPRQRWLPRPRFSLASLLIASVWAGCFMLFYRQYPSWQWRDTGLKSPGPMALSADGSVAAVPTDNGVAILDLATAKPVRVLPCTIPPPQQVSLPHNARFLLLRCRAGDKETLELWDVHTGTQLASFPALGISESGGVLVTPGAERLILPGGGFPSGARILEMPSGKPLMTLASEMAMVDFFDEEKHRQFQREQDNAVQAAVAAPNLSAFLRAFTGHCLDLDVAVSPDGSHLATYLRGATIQLWDPVTERKIKDLPMPGGWDSIFGWGFSDDARLLWLKPYPWPRLYVLDVDTGQVLFTATGPHVGGAEAVIEEGVIGLRSSPSGESDWDMATGHCLWAGPSRGERSRWVAGGRYLEMAEHYRVLDAATEEPLFSLDRLNSDEDCECATEPLFSSTGRILSRTTDSHVLIWSRRRPEYWWGVAWLPEFWALMAMTGVLALSLRRDRTLLRAPVSAEPPAHERAPCKPRRLPAALASAGLLVASAFWLRASWEPMTVERTFCGEPHAPAQMFLSPDGRRIVSATGRDAARIWDAVTGVEIASIGKPQALVTAVVFSPDGRRFATLGDEKAVHVWDADTGRHLGALSPEGTSIWGPDNVAFSPDGHTIVLTASYHASVWNVDTGRQVAAPADMVMLTCHPALSADGSRVALISGLDKAKVFDARSAAAISSFSAGNASSCFSLALSPDGRSAAVGVDGNVVHVFAADTGKTLFSLAWHKNTVRHLRYSPDGSKLASTDDVDCTVLWDAASGARIVTLSPDTCNLNGVSFDSRWERALFVCQDGTARVVDVKTGRETLALQQHSRQVCDAVFVADSRRIVTASSDGEAQVWKPRPLLAMPAFLLLVFAACGLLASVVLLLKRRPRIAAPEHSAGDVPVR
jgi:WD40 repeat protein